MAATPPTRRTNVRRLEASPISRAIPSNTGAFIVVDSLRLLPVGRYGLSPSGCPGPYEMHRSHHMGPTSFPGLGRHVRSVDVVHDEPRTALRRMLLASLIANWSVVLGIRQDGE